MRLNTSDGSMEVHVSEPSQAPRAGVIVIMEAFGLNDHIKDICARFSELGYVAIAPDLYHRFGKGIVVDYGDRKAIMPLLARLTNEELLTDVTACFNFLKERGLTKVFTIGFCMGGFTSILASTRLALAGAISFYGAGLVVEREGIGFKPFLNDFNRIKCPLLFFYGEKDSSIPLDDIEDVHARLENAHVKHEVIVCENSDHGFFCDQRKSYNPETAKKAWDRTLAWMEELLRRA